MDTNILLRFADRSHPLYPVIRTAVKKLRQDGYKLQVASQNCVEFWNVVTRPIEKNGFGLTPEKCRSPVTPDRASFSAVSRHAFNILRVA
ncbi:hypothetical protein QUA97_05170 [Microcoleus sp. CZ3-B2]|uniref:hypothetical protein n=1 Tax=Tychonema sp. LEGE 06208 TaxID=1828663 RepID=UPI0030D6F0E0